LDKDRTYMICGLGNPGAAYQGTRHNLGFSLLEYFRSFCLPGCEFHFQPEYQAEMTEGIIDGLRVVLVRPQTWMNRSGQTLAAMTALLNAGWQLIVVHDDLDLELGRIRIKQCGGAGGHNGLKSIIAALGHGDFIRLRLGINGTERGNTVDYVLAPFSEAEQPAVDQLLERGCQALKEIMISGLVAAMNQFNRRVES